MDTIICVMNSHAYAETASQHKQHDAGLWRLFWLGSTVVIHIMWGLYPVACRWLQVTTVPLPSCCSVSNELVGIHSSDNPHRKCMCPLVASLQEGDSHSIHAPLFRKSAGKLYFSSSEIANFVTRLRFTFAGRYGLALYHCNPKQP